MLRPLPRSYPSNDLSRGYQPCGLHPPANGWEPYGLGRTKNRATVDGQFGRPSGPSTSFLPEEAGPLSLREKVGVREVFF